MIELNLDHPSGETLAALGDIAFLAGRSPTHKTMPVVALRAWWEVPVALKQYWVFRGNGYPRLAISWAALSPEAEHRYAVARTGLRPEDWRSGSQHWVIDWIAPFQIPKLNTHARRWIATNGFRNADSVRFMRVSGGDTQARIFEIRRNGPDMFERRLLSPADLGSSDAGAA